MPRPIDLLDRLLAGRPAVPLALRSALAAVLAWLAVVPLGGVADDYPYYAPLGAVVAVSGTVAGSFRTARQTVVALLLGASLGLLAMGSGLPGVVALALVVGLGTVASTWWWLGTMGSWVPISGLFVLVLGQAHPGWFVLGYLGLTTLGVLVGATTNALLPPLRLAEVQQAVDGLRTLLVEQLDELAADLERGPLPPEQDPAVLRARTDERARQVQELLAGTTDGTHLNWRVRRSAGRAEAQRREARALVDLAALVGDLGEFVARRERADQDEVVLGPDLRPPAANALRATAAVLRTVEVGGGDGPTAPAAVLRRGCEAVTGLADCVRALRRRTGADLFGAGTLVTGLERAIAPVRPRSGSGLRRAA